MNRTVVPQRRIVCAVVPQGRIVCAVRGGRSHNGDSVNQQGLHPAYRLETRQITAYISLGREDQVAASPNPAHVATPRMADRLRSEGGRARYRRRKAIVEPVIGWIKEVLGFRRFSLRGEAHARAEWNVVCLAANLKRFHRIQMA